MSAVSLLHVRVRAGERDRAIAAFQDRRVLAECAAAIPGFVSGSVLADRDSLDRLVIMTEWTDAQSYLDWAEHPARQSQIRDLAHFLAEPPTTRLLDSVTSLGRCDTKEMSRRG